MRAPSAEIRRTISRLRRPMGDLPLFAFVVIVIAVALSRGGGRGIDRAEINDVRLSVDPAVTKDGGRCPAGFPFKTYDGDIYYYPPAHPGAFDVSTAPDQCFSTQEGANRAGFALAPVPAGSDVAGGSYFVPTDAKLERQCTEAARRLRFQVPCPKLLPVTPTTSEGREAVRCDRGFLFSTDCIYADTFFLKGNTFVFTATPTSTRHVGIGYFIITAWRRGAAPPSTGRAAPLECPTGELARTRESPGGAVWLSCSAWAGREETAMSVLRWTNHRTTIHVGVHGHPPFDAEIAATIADYLEYVGIDSSAPAAR